MNRDREIKVSACIITHNHKNFIEKCLRGAIAQKIENYEIVVGDDCSDDNTSQIIEKYYKKHPILIRHIRRDSNLGMNMNWLETIKSSKGKYIALCEGDDYWTDSYKLQKQVDFLDSNPDYAICFHRVSKVDSDGKSLETNLKIVEDTTDIMDLAKGNFIHTPSVVFRNDFKIPNWFSNTTLADWTLYLISIGGRKIKFLNEVMACYRIHNNGIWSMKSDRDKRKGTIETIHVMLRSSFFEKKVERILEAYADELRAQNSVENRSVFCKKLKRGKNIFSSLMSKLLK